MRRHTTRLWGLPLVTWALVIGLVAAPMIAAATPTSRNANLIGHVISMESGRPIDAARVTIAGINLVTLTNELGFFTFRDLPVGVHRITVEHIGHATRTVQVRFADDENYETEIMLGPQPIELEGLSVTVVPRRLFNDMEGLALRMDAGFGDFLLRTEIEVRGGNLATMLQGRSGIQIKGGGSGVVGQVVVLRRATHMTSNGVGDISFEDCYPAVFVDGRRWSKRSSLGDEPTDVAEFIASDMEAVEVYKGSSVPGEFGGGDAACGAIIVWTRRGPARRLRGVPGSVGS